MIFYCKQRTAYEMRISDWSSDVCSSDLAMDLLADNVFYHNVPLEPIVGRENVRAFTHAFGMGTRLRPEWELLAIASIADTVLTERRSEERRVGKTCVRRCRSKLSPSN